MTWRWVLQPVRWVRNGVVQPVRWARKGVDRSMRAALLGVLRHALTTLGGSFVTSGLLSADELQQLVGAVLTMVGIGWSVIEKRQRRA